MSRIITQLILWILPQTISIRIFAFQALSSSLLTRYSTFHLSSQFLDEDSGPHIWLCLPETLMNLSIIMLTAYPSICIQANVSMHCSSGSFFFLSTLFFSLPLFSSSNSTRGWLKGSLCPWVVVASLTTGAVILCSVFLFFSFLPILLCILFFLLLVCLFLTSV